MLYKSDNCLGWIIEESINITSEVRGILMTMKTELESANLDADIKGYYDKFKKIMANLTRMNATLDTTGENNLTKVIEGINKKIADNKELNDLMEKKV